MSVAIIVTVMYIVISVLSLPLLSQHCACFRCHSAVLVCAVTMLCTSASDRCGSPPSKEGDTHKLQSKSENIGSSLGSMVLSSSLINELFDNAREGVSGRVFHTSFSQNQ